MNEHLNNRREPELFAAAVGAAASQAPPVRAAPDHAAALLEKIGARTAQITVVGQGYVGLPLAVAFGRMGFQVTGLDVDHAKVDRLRAGQADSPDVTDAELLALADDERYRPTADLACLDESDAILICVPTPLRKTKDPDISYVLDAAERLASRLRPGQLIILESTTYPGTTEEVLLPLFEANGLQAGRDFFLAFSPERIDPGNKRFKVRDIPKVCGGVTPTCTRLAAALYRQIVDTVVEVSTPRVAELAKLYENVFRSVNIALANEFSLMCSQLGISSREVIDAAASKPFGFMPFYPGPGIGGHCVPIDPAYLAWKMRLNNYEARFIPLAEEINRSMPGHVVTLVANALNRGRRCLNGAKVLAFGVAYKSGVGDTRESPALQVIAELLERGAEVAYADPHVPSVVVNGRRLDSLQPGAAELRAADCVLILTDHPEFDYREIVAAGRLVVDTRNATYGLSAGNAQLVRL
jgi:UDP-N-acetyl-D-glucosamine dehydrogenase